MDVAPSLRPGDFVAAVEVTTKAGAVLAVPGEVCDRVPVEALGWLLECGAIVPAPGGDQ